MLTWLDRVTKLSTARLAPAPRIDLATWIEANLVIPEGMSFRAGPVELIPYQRGICDALSNPEVERITVVKSARLGYARSAEAAEKVVATIKQSGGKATAVQADISQPEQIEGLFEQARSAFGQVDILVNNAGIYDFGDLASITPESIDRQFALNVKGLILATQAAAQAFPATGVVVVISLSGSPSRRSHRPRVYSATKCAVDNLTRSLALELGPRKIRVVGIAPGITATEGTSGMGEDMMAPIVARTPLGRIGQPADIAAAVAFAVSTDAGWLTGETIQVGGGLLL